jgi:hypothetical protein
MALSWYLVRNHLKGRMRAADDFGAEVSESLQKFEIASGVTVDDLLQEELGVGQWLPVGDADSNFSHPVVRAELHGDLTLVALAVPSSLRNGISDFTYILILAHPKALLTIIRDPKGAFAADFGGLVLADFKRHQSGERSFTAGEAVFRAVRSSVVGIENSLATLRATVESCFKTLRAIELREQRVGEDLDELEAEFGKTLAELRAIVRTPLQLQRVCDQLEEWASSDRENPLFDSTVARRAVFLKMKVEQIESVLGTFLLEIERAIKRCDDVSKRQLLDAQRNNTYWTSALLLPNLIFAFFGQSFLGDARDGKLFWWISGLALAAYGAASTYFLLKRSRRLR